MVSRKLKEGIPYRVLIVGWVTIVIMNIKSIEINSPLETCIGGLEEENLSGMAPYSHTSFSLLKQFDLVMIIGLFY